jgi:DNA modification methylase
MIEPRYQSDRVTLYCADCLQVLPQLEAGSVDAVVTDPPYGVGLGEVVNGQAIEKNQQRYTAFSDTPEYINDVVVPAIRLALEVGKRGIVTPGNRNAFRYPEPADIGVWYNPAGAGRGKWGFILAHLIFYYGADPKAGKNAIASSVWAHNDSVADIKNIVHPCPKPLKFTRWLVQKASSVNDIILDPFMGSGTTGVACMQTGRKFIGIEIDEGYYQIAEKRIRQAESQLLLGI